MQARIEVDRLPEPALEAAATFHRDYVATVRDALSGGAGAAALLLPPAPYDHRDWRLAAARDLARAFPDNRVNIVAGDDPAAVEGALAYLAGAAGVTGQYLELDGFGAGNPAG